MLKFKYFKLKKYVSETDRFVTSAQFKALCYEIIRNFSIPYVYLNDSTYLSYNSELGLFVNYRVNDFLCALLMIRVLSMWAMMFSGIKYNSSRAERLA